MAGDDEATAAAAEEERIGERMTWLFWSVPSIVAIMYCTLSLNIKIKTQRLGHPPDKNAQLYPPLVLLLICSLVVFNAVLLSYLTIFLKITKPLELSRRVRMLIDVSFALFDFGLAAFFCDKRRDRDDIWFVLLGFSLCHFFFPIFNLLAFFPIFSLLDAAQAALIQAAALATCFYAPHSVVALVALILSLALILVPKSSDDDDNKKQQQQQKHSGEDDADNKKQQQQKHSGEEELLETTTSIV